MQMGANMKRKKLFCCGILLALCLGIHGWAAPSDLLLQEGEMDFDQVYERYGAGL